MPTEFDGLKYLLSLFPKWERTPEQLVVWERMLKSADPQAIRAAIDKHYVDRGSFTAPVLRDVEAMLKQAKAKHGDGRTQNARDQRVIAWLRRELPRRFAGMDDVTALTAHFKAAWREAEDAAADEAGKTFTRGLIAAHARAAFQQIGWPASDAAEIAREIVGLEPGQRLRLSWVRSEEHGEIPVPDVALAECVGQEH